jgi:hypothetical protein
MKFFILSIFTLFISQIASAHSMLTFPAPRSTSSGLKTGPCGGLPHSANPTVVQGGQSLSVSWQETVNHPGRFLFALSTANDSNFQQNPLATVVDNQDNGLVPHNYTTTLQIPNMNCDNCTIQMIQSMEENPNAPTYYYSCADIKIVANTAGGGGNNIVNGQKSNSSQTIAPKMGGCGLVKEQTPPNLKLMSLILMFFFLPLSVLGIQRHRRSIVKAKALPI